MALAGCLVARWWCPVRATTEAALSTVVTSPELATLGTCPRFSWSRLGKPAVDVVGLKKRAGSLSWSESKGVQQQVPIDCAQIVEGADVDRRLVPFMDDVVAYPEQSFQSKLGPDLPQFFLIR